jgi:catechol 2,3-dioxygenase-like lactoylglutathione lyase family enzyme
MQASVSFPIAQVRVARATHQLEAVSDFYLRGLGLPELYRFEDHGGFRGIMIGLPGTACHLEFTQEADTPPCPPPSPDHLLVLYYPDEADRDQACQMLDAWGAVPSTPYNPYWAAQGVTYEDPDGWRVVLFAGRFAAAQ